MQSVSDAWKENQLKYFVDEAYVEVKLQIGDPDAMADATSSANGEESFSDVSEVASGLEKNPSKFSTLEKNIWSLDRTCHILPPSGYGEQGYIGDVLCDGNGEFTTHPTITITFGQVFTAVIPGISICWGEAYDEYADSFSITAYNGTTQVAQRTVTGNTDLTSVELFDIENYDKIVVEITKWCLPYRRARIKSVFLGIERVFNRSDIFEYEHNMSVDPLSASCPQAEIRFSVKNLDGEFSPDNQQGFAKYMLARQLITAKYGYKINNAVEWIKAGTFFLNAWEMPQNGITATFTARDALEYMSAVYTGTTTGTLYQIATAAFTQASLPLMSDGSNRWTIDNSLQSINAPTTVDIGDASIMTVLQYCANAACCVFYQDRNGLLHIEPLASGMTDYQINRFNSYQNSELQLNKQLKEVNVNNGQYVLSVGSAGESQPIDNPLISDAQAPTVAAWSRDYLVNRQTVSGNFRADPRLDPLDRVTNKNQFGESIVLVTQFGITYNGAFGGSYEGRRGV